jgi:hypothetical protein
MTDLAPKKASEHPSERWVRLGPILLLLLTALAYLPSLGGGFLNMDDPWLLESNRMLHHPSWGALWAVWTDLSLPRRLTFGAEYLPLRDTSHLIEACLTGISPLPLRLVNLSLYLGVIVVVYRLLRTVLQIEVSALLVTAVFALHPVHVESVAWLAGRKDLLAMLFAALAMHAYATRRQRALFWTPFWFLLAMLSKSMSVALPLLLPLFDIWAKKRPNFKVIGASLIAVAMTMPIHLYVGHLVGMTQPHESVSGALATMGPVWLRYIGVLLWPRGCSLVHEVPTSNGWGFIAVLGNLCVAVIGVLAVQHWRAKRPQWLLAMGFFLIPLLPVSQIIAPLQNKMADRYLWWSVIALGVVLLQLTKNWPRVGIIVCLTFLGFCLAVTAERASLFGNSALAFADATRKTSHNGVAPYQLAMALEAQGDNEPAREAYEEVWRRTQGCNDTARRATNNLARLEARQGNLDRAEWVLRRGLQHFPSDPVMQGNLAKVKAKQQLAVEQSTDPHRTAAPTEKP